MYVNLRYLLYDYISSVNEVENILSRMRKIIYFKVWYAVDLDFLEIRVVALTKISAHDTRQLAPYLLTGLSRCRGIRQSLFQKL